MKKLRNDLKGLVDLLENRTPKKTVQQLFDDIMDDTTEIEFEWVRPGELLDPLGLRHPEPSQEEQEANMDFWKDNSK